MTWSNTVDEYPNGNCYKTTSKANTFQREMTAFSLPAVLGFSVLFYLGILRTAQISNTHINSKTEESSQTSDAFHKSHQQMSLSWHGVLRVALIKKKKIKVGGSNYHSELTAIPHTEMLMQLVTPASQPTLMQNCTFMTGCMKLNPKQSWKNAMSEAVSQHIFTCSLQVLGASSWYWHMGYKQ